MSLYWQTDDLVNPPYTSGEFKGRNWGHPWHSLCSYHGKLKPSIAHAIVRDFSDQGDTVLDPLAGVGTIPLEARLQGRTAIGNDFSSFAATVNRAKLNTPDEGKLWNLLNDFEEAINSPEQKKNAVKAFDDFGFNGRISDYYQNDTLQEILTLRYLLGSDCRRSPEGALIFSAFAHVLHGNRPYALSRRSHPLTPYAPAGEFEYKNVILHIKNKLKRSLKDDAFGLFAERDGLSYQVDYRDLSTESWYGEVDLVATSPPFISSLKFATHNWLRLWLSGWEKSDFSKAGSDLERGGSSAVSAYREFIEFSFSALKPGGLIVMHTGRNSKYDMGEMIARIGSEYGRAHLASESVVGNERHGVRDKGGTTEHQFIFLTKEM